jgi:hypothetical protein
MRLACAYGGSDNDVQGNRICKPLPIREVLTGCPCETCDVVPGSVKEAVFALVTETALCAILAGTGLVSLELFAVTTGTMQFGSKVRPELAASSHLYYYLF